MCGIGALISVLPVRESLEAALDVSKNRGDEGAGILLDTPDGVVVGKKAGPYDNSISLLAPGVDAHSGVLHSRYNTIPKSALDEAAMEKRTQPFLLEDRGIGFVHNGQVENMDELTQLVRSWGADLVSDSDAELLMHTFHHFYANEHGSVERKARQAVLKTQEVAKGGYSCLVAIHNVGVLAFRDPDHIRPLRYAISDTDMGFASESRALEAMGFTSTLDVPEGKAILARNDHTYDFLDISSSGVSGCILEPFYFHSNQSIWRDKKVAVWRYEYSRKLARLVEHLNIQAVGGVPYTGLDYSEGIADALGVPHVRFIKTPDELGGDSVGRVFITPEGDRAAKAKKKFIPYLTALVDQFGSRDLSNINALIVDDCIIRGTNMTATTSNLRDASMLETIPLGNFYGLSALSQYVNSCRYGMDVYGDRIANQHDLPGMASRLGLAEVIFPTVDQVKEFVGRSDYCMACLTGEYPTDRQQNPEIPLPILASFHT